MKVTIVSPEKTLYAGEAESVALPGKKGRFEVLRNHAPIISTLSEGTVTVTGDTPFKLEVSGGFVEVARNEVIVCAEVKTASA